MIQKVRKQMSEEDYVGQTCVKIRLFGDEEKLNEKGIENITEKLSDVLAENGFGSSNDSMNSIITVNATDIIPDDIDEEGLVDFLVKYEKSALIIIPTGEDNE